MADFTNGFWSIYIAVLALLGIVGCGVFYGFNPGRRSLFKAALAVALKRPDIPGMRV